MTAERVLVQEYDSIDDAKAAEDLLIEMGANKNMVFRSGKRLRVIDTYETRARELLGLEPGSITDPDVDADPSATDAFDMAPAGVPPTSSFMGDVLETSPAAYSADPLIGSTEPFMTDDLTTTSPVSEETSGQGVVASATDTVQETAASVVGAAQQAAETTVEKVQDVADAATGRVGTVMAAAADRLEAASDTVEQKGADPSASTPQRVAAQTTSNTLDKVSQYLRNPDIKVAAEDLRGSVRRNPTRSLIVGFSLGYLLRGRFFPSGSVPTIGAEAERSTSTPTSTPDASYVPAPLATEPMVGDATAGLYASDVYIDPIADPAMQGSTEMFDAAPPVSGSELEGEQDVLVFEVDPVTGEAISVTSTTMDVESDPSNPRDDR